MEQWKKDRIRGAWSFAWVFALVFHQLIIPYFSGGDYKTVSFLITTVYFGVITFFFTWAFLLLPAWMVAIILFIYGAFVELFIFGVIIDPILAGLFYIAMFFIPRWISRRMYKPENESASDIE